MASSASAPPQKVHFSKGNLYAKKEGDKWGWYFYDRQYQINSLYVYSYRTAQSTDTEIDLFCWGYDATGSVNPTERTTRNQFVDWGSTIDNNGTWRTLTQQEWDYLLNTRTVNGGTKEGKSYQRATINNDTSKPVYGLIVYPDDYTSQTTAKIYTKREWAALEAEGCVFLPAAGYRSENYCTLNKGNGAKWGTYWTATAVGYGAYLMDFTNESVSTSNNDYALYGHSVRLVTNVTAE